MVNVEGLLVSYGDSSKKTALARFSTSNPEPILRLCSSVKTNCFMEDKTQQQQKNVDPPHFGGLSHGGVIKKQAEKKKEV